MHRDVNYAPAPSQWQRKGDKEEKEEDDQQRGGRGVRRQHLAPRSDTPNGGGRRSHRRSSLPRSLIDDGSAVILRRRRRCPRPFGNGARPPPIPDRQAETRKSNISRFARSSLPPPRQTHNHSGPEPTLGWDEKPRK